MTLLKTSFGGLAIASLALALGACASDPADKTVASAARGPAPDCPIGTHICRHQSASPADSISAEEMRKQGVTGLGTTALNPPPVGGR